SLRFLLEAGRNLARRRFCVSGRELLPLLVSPDFRRVGSDGFFVDVNPKTRLVRNFEEAILYRVGFRASLLPPRHVIGLIFKDEEVWHSGNKVNRLQRAEDTMRIVGRKHDVIGVGIIRYLFALGDAIPNGVGHDNFAGMAFEEGLIFVAAAQAFADANRGT